MQGSAVPAEYGEQFARLAIPEAEGRIVRRGDQARTVRTEDDMLHITRVPAKDGQRLPRDRSVIARKAGARNPRLDATAPPAVALRPGKLCHRRPRQRIGAR